ncbi:hypothetical protein CPT_MyoSmar_070 [Serratia phage MyoSmar]|uniref:Tail sheath protein n=2 Tax=Myosmarvirus TaxID=2843428 RepID=A0A9E8G293_9CAUD|nr:tail sheath [Serratia phage MyoSmar]QEG09519.1 hypothetical protein CPT_MyoSmar_070 [Serratia phage MyoSmar]UZS00325.1 hypothetical protein [Serratia phage SMP]
MISQSRYIKIVSGVGAGNSIAQRQLILRLITQNAMLPPGIVMEFSNPDAVGSFFGTSSEEYKRARDYFSFISKLVNSPGKISFARWVNTAIAPMIIGDTVEKTLGDFTNTQPSSIVLVSNGVAKTIGPIDLTTATDLAAVASIVQSAITTGQTTDEQLKSCTVTYNAVTGQFNLTGSVTGSGSISCIKHTDAGSDFGALLGWNTTGAVAVAGQAADDASTAVSKSANISNNFGSFAFTTPAVALSNEDIAEIAAWNHSQNNMYMYTLATPIGNLAALYELVKGYSGCAINITGAQNDFIEQSPAEILAATNYNNVNSTQNYMFYSFANRAVTVSDDTTADMVDSYRGNYIGVTQSAGQPLAFYQRGVLCGGASDAIDMNTYANEMWMKATISRDILAMFMNQPIISADTDGEATVLGVLQGVVNAAQLNGVISQGKPIDITKQQYITQLTGDPMAWRQVASIGYWLDVSLTNTTDQTGREEWIIDYVIVYGKKDAVRKVTGRDVLI